MKSIVITITAFILLINCSCSEKGTEPQITNSDTTSHNFTWQIDTIGIEGSWLRDIAVIAEDDIWAVGRIEKDTARNRGNLVKWDGEKWEIIDLTYYGPNGGEFRPDGQTLFPFTSGEVIVSTGARIQTWNGSSYIQESGHLSINTGSIRKIWGRSPDDYYLAGTSGMILHHKDGIWETMDSGTDIDIRDIDGYGDHVFAIAFSEVWPSAVLEYYNGRWRTLFSSTTYFGDLKENDYGRTTAIKVFEDKAYIVSKAGLIIYNYKTKKTNLIPADEALMTGHDYIRISGKENDLVLIGKVGQIIHYNGSTWRMFDAAAGISGLRVSSGYINGDIIATCGEGYGFISVIVRGIRN